MSNCHRYFKGWGRVQGKYDQEDCKSLILHNIFYFEKRPAKVILSEIDLVSLGVKLIRKVIMVFHKVLHLTQQEEFYRFCMKIKIKLLIFLLNEQLHIYHWDMYRFLYFVFQLVSSDDGSVGGESDIWTEYGGEVGICLIFKHWNFIKCIYIRLLRTNQGRTESTQSGSPLRTSWHKRFKERKEGRGSP